jgi:hypothetical protein
MGIPTARKSRIAICLFINGLLTGSLGFHFGESRLEGVAVIGLVFTDLLEMLRDGLIPSGVGAPRRMHGTGGPIKDLPIQIIAGGTPPLAGSESTQPAFPRWRANS